jgi:hypothetical protein
MNRELEIAIQLPSPSVMSMRRYTDCTRTSEVPTFSWPLCIVGQVTTSSNAGVAPWTIDQQRRWPYGTDKTDKCVVPLVGIGMKVFAVVIRVHFLAALD